MHMRLTVTRDAEFAGVPMQKGQKIAMWYISANRDEKYFPDPYRFDIARTPNEQGAFGTGGAHFCLGSHLARREVTSMFVELFRRLPDIEATAAPRSCARTSSAASSGCQWRSDQPERRQDPRQLPVSSARGFANWVTPRGGRRTHSPITCAD